MTTANTMNVAKLFRCAIYARKSTEHNLDLAFNSHRLTFRKQEFAILRQRDAVGAACPFAYHRNLASRVEMIGLSDPDVGKIKTAISSTDRTFGENETFLDKLRNHRNRVR